MWSLSTSTALEALYNDASFMHNIHAPRAEAAMQEFNRFIRSNKGFGGALLKGSQARRKPRIPRRPV